MYQRETIIQNASGLHARPASEFVQCAGQFQSEIFIRRADSSTQANAKSIVMLLTLALSKGTAVCISAVGPDEREAVDQLTALVDSGFSEPFNESASP